MPPWQHWVGGRDPPASCGDYAHGAPSIELTKSLIYTHINLCLDMPLRITFFLLILFTSCSQKPTETRLEESPRHHEWADIQVGDRTLKAYVAYPEEAKNTPALVVIHENRGLNDWARSLADQIAEAGYIAIAPDLLSGAGPNGGGTSAFATSDDARTGIYGLDPDQVTADLFASIEYASSLDSSNGTVAAIGFCWGGSQTFRLAGNTDAIKAAYVFYGTGPDDPESYGAIEMPVYGFYGGNDNRVNASIPNSEKLMAQYQKFYEPVVYDGAGHGFFRSGEAEDASAENKKAREDAWVRLKGLLAEL